MNQLLTLRRNHFGFSTYWRVNEWHLGCHSETFYLRNPGFSPAVPRTRRIMGYREYYVYILASPSRTLYVGVTNDLVRRIREHRWKMNAGLTAKYHVSNLVYF